MAERILAVGLNGPQFEAEWRSPDLPAPTVTQTIESKPGRNGWILVEQLPEQE